MTTDWQKLSLSHGQAVWVLSNMGFHTGDSESAFNSYIKHLRRSGLPFAKDEMGAGAGHDVIYRFEHLMELVVALALRAQAILPRDVVEILAAQRGKLRPIYRKAYAEKDSGLGAPCEVKVTGKRPFNMTGIYLDLGLAYAETGFLLQGPIKALGPADAIERFGTAHMAQHVRDPIKLSDLAEDVVRLAAGAPEIRRGRQ